MTYFELKNKINNVVETIKGQTNISGYKLNVILNDLLNFINNNSPTKNYNEIIFKCTDTTGGDGEFTADIIGFDSNLNETVEINREGVGIYKITSSLNLANATAIVSSFEGVCLVEYAALDPQPGIKITTKSIVNGDDSDPISYVSADNLLKETAIRVVIAAV